MNVVVAASEVTPFSKTGGLADVAGSLPKYLAKLGHTVSVIAPLYRATKTGGPEIQDTGRFVNVQIMDKPVTGRIFESTLPGSEVPVYLISNDDYYGREDLYFFFAADVRQSPTIQIQNPVNGIWLSKRTGGAWQEPTLVWLQQPGSSALNGCPYVGGNELYFCTAREGYFGINWFKAEYVDGAWKNWILQGFDPTFQVGELHIYDDKLYYHSDRDDGLGGIDIWTLTWTDNQWANPENVSAVNSSGDESRPYLTPDGNELWITRTVDGTPAIFRSKKVDGSWQEPEMIVSQFAGEATLDAEGNLYFVHHFYDNNIMIEADIYVAYRK